MEVVEKRSDSGYINNLKVDENTCSGSSHDLSWSGNDMRIKTVRLISWEI